MPRGYWPLWTATLLFFAAFYTLAVAVPLHLDRLPLPDWQTALVLGSFGMAALVLRPASGLLADWGGHRPVLLLGACCLGLGALGQALLEMPLALIGWRLVQAAGYVAFTTAATARLVALTPPHQRGRALAWYGTAANLAICLVPAAALSNLPNRPLQSAFFVAAVLAAIALVPAFMGPTPTAQPGPAPPPMLVAFRHLHRPMVLALLFGIGYGAFLKFLPVLALRRGIEMGWIYALYGLVIILMRASVGSFIDRCHRPSTLALGFVCLLGGMLFFALSHSLAGLLAGAACMAAAGGLLHPLLIAIHVHNSHQWALAGGSAAFYFGFDLGLGAGPWLAAPLFERFDIAAVYSLAAGAAVLGLGLIGASWRQAIWQRPVPSQENT